MNFRTKNPAPPSSFINQGYPVAPNSGYSSFRSPIKYTEPLSNPYRYSELAYKPVPVGDSKTKVSFSSATSATYSSIPTARDHEYSQPITVNTEQQKQKFREVSDSLAQLKKRLQGIIIEKNQQASDRANATYLNRSLDKQAPQSHRTPIIESNYRNQQFEDIGNKKISIQGNVSNFEISKPKRFSTEQTYNSDTKINNNQDNISTISQTYKNKILPTPEKKLTTQQDRDYLYKTEPRNQQKYTEAPSTHRKNLEFQQEKREMQQRIEEMRKQMEGLLNEKSQIKQMLEMEQKNTIDLQRKYTRVCEQLEEYKKKELHFKERVRGLEREIMHIKSKSRNSFDDVLKDQMQEAQKIKQAIEEKNEEISKLNDIVLMNRRNAEQATNNANIERLKFITEKKQMEQMHEIDSLNRQNQIKTLRHALETMEAKLQVAVRQSKTKDQFIQQYLVGRVKSEEEKEHVKKVLNKHVIDFPTNNLKDKLLEQHLEIERLKRILASQTKP